MALSNNPRVEFLKKVITGDPPPEIEEQGHDRCPIFLQETLIDDWLQPQGKFQAHYYELLQRKEPFHYRHRPLD